MCALQARYEDDDDDDGPAADPQLEGGMPLPIRQVDHDNGDDGKGFGPKLVICGKYRSVLIYV